MINHLSRNHLSRNHLNHLNTQLNLFLNLSLISVLKKKITTHLEYTVEDIQTVEMLERNLQLPIDLTDSNNDVCEKHSLGFNENLNDKLISAVLTYIKTINSETSTILATITRID